MYSLQALGWDGFFEQQLSDDERERLTPARVVWGAREHYRLSTGEADSLASLSGRLRHAAASDAELPVVGDWVLAGLQRDGATIHRVLARRSCFSRAAAGRSAREQVLAANVDLAVIVTSLNHDLNIRRLERYLTLAWENGAHPIIVLNKADLCADVDASLSKAAAVSQGLSVLVTSGACGDGVSELRDAIRNAGTAAFLGSSGVGKSTLINALIGRDEQTVRPIRASDDRGRHATTARELFVVPEGGVVIDTPGLRELQLWHADDGLSQAFEDIAGLAERCRFRDCAHDREPGCAVTTAIEAGRLSPDRLDNYLRLRRENKYMESRADPEARSARTRRDKRIAKSVRLQYKLRRR